MSLQQRTVPLWLWPIVFSSMLTALGYIVARFTAALLEGPLGTGLGYFFPIYGGFWGVVIGIIFSVNLHQGCTPTEARNSALGWAVIWHALVAAFVGGGAVTGALLFLVIGSLAGLDYSVRELLLNGAGDGAFYLLIWSPGLALVLCIMRAYRRSQNKAG